MQPFHQKHQRYRNKPQFHRSNFNGYTPIKIAGHWFLRCELNIELALRKVSKCYDLFFENALLSKRTKKKGSES